MNEIKQLLITIAALTFINFILKIIFNFDWNFVLSAVYGLVVLLLLSGVIHLYNLWIKK